MINRRQLLKRTGAFGLLPVSSIAHSLMPYSPAHAQTGGGYKALVCLFMFGGLDNWDTIIPTDTSSRTTYENIRQGLLETYETNNTSRSVGNLLPLTIRNATPFNGREFAMPSEMSALHNLYERGKAAIVGNVGPLVSPLLRDNFIDGNVPLPPRLFSHNDQQSIWVTNSPEGEAQEGWGGLIANQVQNLNNNRAFTSIATSRRNIFLEQENVDTFTIPPRPLTLDETSRNASTAFRRNSQNGDNGATNSESSPSPAAQNLFISDYADAAESAFATNAVFNAALSERFPLTTVFPNTIVGRSLERVAELISLRQAFGAQRQIFYASRDQFDSHGNQAIWMPILQKEISDAIGSFYEAMVELGVENDVTLFTGSDFGRSLAVNGDGTDHGWGGHHFVVGGDVNGQDIYGDIPLAEFGHELDANNGRLIPSTAIDQYGATLARWFGLTNEQIASVFPNLAIFERTDLGFMRV